MKATTSSAPPSRYRKGSFFSARDTSSTVSGAPPKCLRSEAGSPFVPAMPLPYKIATLLYCFNDQDEVLLLERTQEPNLGLWSPCGGKLHTDEGESPYACACREAK